MGQEGSSTQAAQGQDKRLEVELGTITSDCAALDQKHLPIRAKIQVSWWGRR